MRVYVAGYQSGITLAERDPESGTLTAVDNVAVPAPSFLAWHPDGRHLYAVDERREGAVVAFRAGGDGRLEQLNSQPTGGDSPCHLAVHPAGRHLVSANYGSGSVSAHPIGADGSLGPRTDLVQHRGDGPRAGRQVGPHAHQVRVTPDGGLILAADLGVDSVFAYRLDLATGKLALDSAARTAPGAGPRHLAFGPESTVHVACELDSTVTTFGLDGGSLTPLGAVPSTVEPLRAENSPSEITASTDGRFVYVANRGQDVVTVFATAGTGLRPLVDVACGGHWPRHIAVIGQHLYVANERSDQVSCFRLDPRTGIPEPTGTALAVKTPACVLAAPA